jgi:hypothetical protein
VRATGRRRLLVVWLVLAVLVLAIVVTEYVDHRRATSGADADDHALLPAPVEQLAAVELADRGRLHRFERDARGTWFYHGMHTATTADHAHAADPELADRIARTVSAFARTRIERQFPLDGDGAAYGVTTPELVVLVYRRDQPQPLAQYAVGHVAPDTLSRYVAAVGTRMVVTIPKYQIDNLQALVHAAGERAAQEPAGRR